MYWNQLFVDATPMVNTVGIAINLYGGYLLIMGILSAGYKALDEQASGFGGGIFGGQVFWLEYSKFGVKIGLLAIGIGSLCQFISNWYMEHWLVCWPIIAGLTALLIVVLHSITALYGKIYSIRKAVTYSQWNNRRTYESYAVDRVLEFLGSKLKLDSHLQKDIDDITLEFKSLTQDLNWKTLSSQDYNIKWERLKQRAVEAIRRIVTDSLKMEWFN